MGRQDGNYSVPVLTEPKGGPVPKWRGAGRDVQLELDVAAATGEPPSAGGAARGDGPQGPVVGPARSSGSAPARHEPSTDDGSQAEWSAAVAAMLAAWPALAAPLVDELAAAAEAAVSSGDVAALGTLAASAVTVDALTAALSEAMTSAAAGSAAAVVASAAAQGVTVAQPEPATDRLDQIAAVTAALLASGYASAAARRAMLVPAGTVAGVVRTALTEMSGAEKGMVADHIGAALSTAQGLGRTAVYAASPPRLLVADESQEPGSRCEACSRVDGTEYRTLADAEADYPAGIYRACAGGSRCRGFLRAVW